jgi:hypothetical protein
MREQPILPILQQKKIYRLSSTFHDALDKGRLPIQVEKLQSYLKSSMTGSMGVSESLSHQRRRRYMLLCPVHRKIQKIRSQTLRNGTARSCVAA